MSNVAVAVVGAGIIGLTTAITLLERGFDVTIVADRFPKCMNVPEDYDSENFDVYESTNVLVSDVAAASFIPHTENPSPTQMNMLKESKRVFWEHSNLPNTGIKILQGFEWITQIPNQKPWWSEIMQNFRVDTKNRRSPYVGALNYETAIVDSSQYMPWLVSRITALGGSWRRNRVESLVDYCAESGFSAIVNCCGMAAKQLCGDADMVPVFGQVLRVECSALKNQWYRDSTGPHSVSYVYPRSKDIIFGGTKHEDLTGECEPTEDAATAILERCLHIIPQDIKDGIKSGNIPFKVLGWGAGWRPVRKTKSGFRCERDETFSDTIVIHNYGHGGEGYCFSWGSAKHVADTLHMALATSKL